MKIIKKVKFPIVTCTSCGSEFIPNKKDLVNHFFINIKCMANCPICGTRNVVFEPKPANEGKLLGE